MIEVKNLVKQYGNQIAVDDISFTVEDGRVYGFLGPNGAGKTTTMNIITGYLGATSGDVFIDGHSILDEPVEVKRMIGYLPEVPPLYLEMTVEEYLNFSAELKGVTKNEKAEMIEKIKEMTGLGDVYKRLIKNLSKGYRQRVGLAHALMGFPKVLILDEPTVGLDPKQIIEIREIIRELAKEHTVILSSHILQEVSAICDHILIISNGKLVASDTPANLSNNMRNRNILEFSVKGKREEIAKCLSGISDIVNIEFFDTDQVKFGFPEGEQIVSLSVETRGDTDIREELFYILAKNRLPIMTMRLQTLSLEDLFLELTSEKTVVVKNPPYNSKMAQRGAVPDEYDL